MIHLLATVGFIMLYTHTNFTMETVKGYGKKFVDKFMEIEKKYRKTSTDTIGNDDTNVTEDGNDTTGNDENQKCEEEELENY